ncbi:MAG: UV DNA damage repair endonuclease UvsE [Pleurocapsa sp. SU_196_0]|nr:UV DNA damage repair endonuclease UvsE [Pleurocapsa sp. SU_196_0]
MGLVCITASERIRYRTITRTNYLRLQGEARGDKLRELYAFNTAKLLEALEFCFENGIRLYRVTSQLFPMSDLPDGVGETVLTEIAPRLLEVGRRAELYGIRVVVHPEQFVVLSSDSPEVARNAVGILEGHARQMDFMGLPRDQWSMLLIHGGKGGRSDALVERIAALPDFVRLRLALENDEHAYGAAEILEVCQRSGVPMVFDAHHHIIHDKLDSYEHESVAQFTHAARDTWSDPAWQLVHLSNGKERFSDRRHSDLIDQFPSAFLTVPFVEIEAKAKEIAITDLRERLTRDEPVLNVTREPPSENAFPDLE